MERIIQVTADGSHTLLIPHMEVSYHSKHGAIQESMHVFIQAGLHYPEIQNLNAIHILEIGFGSGLNALLTGIEAKKLHKTIQYTAIEAYPLHKEEYRLLNYGEILHQQPLFHTIHEAEWNQMVMLDANFQLCKIHKKVDELMRNSTYNELPPITYYPSPNTYNLIYFDAFAPTAQPELWSAEVFSYLYSLLNLKGILVTYCSKGVVRRTMESVGFKIEKIPGPPGKREMVRALKM
ncbi:MAG: tRNA (5-methylaminomethyl-2-thiouridine)(34)-methyltransferase MnmD [Sediminibacterium sp.]|jgi:tRNA U34 5-methylaminomethyl-2-thiouridine-forming methyltransferase MnmC